MTVVVFGVFRPIDSRVDAASLVFFGQQTVVLLELFGEIGDGADSDGVRDVRDAAVTHRQHMGGILHSLEMAVLHNRIAGVLFELIDQRGLRGRIGAINVRNLGLQVIELIEMVQHILDVAVEVGVQVRLDRF